MGGFGGRLWGVLEIFLKVLCVRKVARKFFEILIIIHPFTHLINNNRPIEDQSYLRHFRFHHTTVKVAVFGAGIHNFQTSELIQFKTLISFNWAETINLYS